MLSLRPCLTILFVCLSCQVQSETSTEPEKPNPAEFKLEDVFSLQWAATPQLSNNGKTLYFTRHSMDIGKDKARSNIWAVDTSSGEMQPVTSGSHSDYDLALSPNGQRLAYLSTATGSAQIHTQWLNSGATAKLSNLQASPSGLSWSPDGKWLAFSMFVKAKPKSVVGLPAKPKGAEWAEPASFIDKTLYRFDGAGYLESGFKQIFIISADGGPARQLTFDEFDHGGRLSWTQDGASILFSANRRDNAEFEPLNSDIYKLDIKTANITQLTDRFGPDENATVAPSGKLIAYTGFDDELKNYENADIYVMEADGGKARNLTEDLDRTIRQIMWSPDSKGVFFSYNDQGKTTLAYQPLRGKRKINMNECSPKII